LEAPMPSCFPGLVFEVGGSRPNFFRGWRQEAEKPENIVLLRCVSRLDAGGRSARKIFLTASLPRCQVDAGSLKAESRKICFSGLAVEAGMRTKIAFFLFLRQGARGYIWKNIPGFIFRGGWLEAENQEFLFPGCVRLIFFRLGRRTWQLETQLCARLVAGGQKAGKHGSPALAVAKEPEKFGFWLHCRS